MKTLAICIHALLSLLTYVHAGSTSCSQGVTVIDGSIPCSGTDCTIMCGEKSSKVVGRYFSNLEADMCSIRRHVITSISPAPIDASCPGSVNARCNGQQVNISRARGAQEAQSSSVQAFPARFTGARQGTFNLGFRVNSTRGDQASSVNGFQGTSLGGVRASSTLGAPGRQITFPGGFVGFPDGS